MDAHDRQSASTNPNHGQADALTAREREVLSLVQQGLTNDEIADELGISRDGVRYHLKELHSKLYTDGDRTTLRRKRWFGIAAFFGGLGEFARPAATATAVVALSAGGYFGVRYAAAQSDDPDAMPDVTSCFGEAIPTPAPGATPLPGAAGPSSNNGTECWHFDSEEAQDAFIDCLLTRNGDIANGVVAECAAKNGGVPEEPTTQPGGEDADEALTDKLFRMFSDAIWYDGTSRIGMSQIIGGVTVTVERAIYDGKSVMNGNAVSAKPVEVRPVFVEFTVSGLSTGSLTNYGIKSSLRTADSAVLPFAGGAGLRGKSDILDRELPPGTEQHLMAYDTSAAQIGPSGMSLRLDVVVTPRHPTGHHAGGLTEFMPTGDPIGPFVFDFTVPVN